MKLFKYLSKFMLLVSISMSLSLVGCSKASTSVNDASAKLERQNHIVEQAIPQSNLDAQSTSKVVNISEGIADEDLSDSKEKEFDLYERSSFFSLNAKPDMKDGAYVLKPIGVGSFFKFDESTERFVFDSNGKWYGFTSDFWGGCSEWCGVDLFDKATSSSTLKQEGNFSYEADNVIYLTSSEEYNPRAHVWCEGAAGDGIGEYIEITRTMLQPDEFKYGKLEDGTVDYSTFHLNESMPLKERKEFEYTSLCIVNGYAENESKWADNGRVKTLKMYVNDKFYGYIELEDTINPQYIPLYDIKSHSTEEMKFKFEIADVYKGLKYDDTCITGIVFGFDGIGEHAVD